MKCSKQEKTLKNMLDFKMQEIAPNLRLLVGASLGAKLISHAGGLKKTCNVSFKHSSDNGCRKRHCSDTPKAGTVRQNTV